MNLEEQMQEWDTNKFVVSKGLHQTVNHIKFNNEKVTIVLMGDTHIGSKFYDEKLHREHLQWCLDSKSPIILMGDNIECATRDSIGAGIYEQDEILDKQIDHFLAIYRPLSKEGLLLGMHTGNHCQRVFKSSGVDIAKQMARQLGIKYFEWAKLHEIHVGKQRYTLYTCHGSSGAKLPTSKMKAAFNMGDVTEAEIYAMGHLHLLAHQARMKYKLNPRTRSMEETEKHFILTGHYLNFWGSYAHMQNLEPNKKGSVKIKLSGLEHQIRISL
jgi:hypothetical protein